MIDSYKQLDHWLSEYSGKVGYGHPLTEKDIQQFETDNKFRLPEDLRAFYHWNNGIKIGDDFQFFSLEEALIIYWNERMKDGSEQTVSEMPVDDSVFSSPEEVHRFREEFQEYRKIKKIQRKEKNLWLPIFAEYRPSFTNYYALCLSEIDRENPDRVMITTKTYSKPFYIRISHLRHERKVHCFTELPALLAASLSQLKPPKTSLWQGLKDVINIIGSLFER